jgi:NAD(P)-dependent dehydrogenase (short-subunit alcohol dehydrogenase family)
MLTVLITGASGNLGRAVVDQFLAQGHRVIGVVIPEDAIPLNIRHTLFTKVEADLGDEAQTRSVIEEQIKLYGGIDVAVLTAGGFAMGKIAETGSAEILKQYRLNFETAYHAARPIFLHMLEKKKGRIFMVGSRPGSDMHAAKGMTAYSLSKSMIFRLAELMNVEAKGTDVVTTVIVPSTIDTPQNRDSMPKADHSAWMDPKAMAEIIFFYTTPAAHGLREPVLKMYNNA